MFHVMTENRAQVARLPISALVHKKTAPDLPLDVLELCARFGKSEYDRMCLEQYRPYIMMMSVRAKACEALKQGYVRTAMGRSITRPSAVLLNTTVHVRAESLSRDFRVYRENGELYQSESEKKDSKIVFEKVNA